MDRKQILQKIDDIHREIRDDQFHILAEKIRQRPFHFHRSNRGFLLRKIIHLFRRKLKNEVELIMNPVLEQHKDIHMRFLYEIQALKQQVYALGQNGKDGRYDKEKNAADSAKPDKSN
jgi:hypothetical protein